MGVIERVKVLYRIYNFFHKKELQHNIPLYKKWGIQKKYYSSISSNDFIHLSSDSIETIGIDKQKLATTKLFKTFNPKTQESLLAFEDKGFAVIENYLSTEQVDEVNAEITRLLENKKVKVSSNQKIMFAIHTSNYLCSIGNDAALKELLSNLIGGQVILFQSINFLMGSEQPTHSDSIHMTTYPLGGLLGVWIALEDITAENGPLHYYPQSHKLPYYMNVDYKNEGNWLFLGNKPYTAYEEMVEKRMKEQKLVKETFLAKKGDLIIWHANLFHGGEPHKNKTLSRKSMVFHYFKEGSICYHEITQRPALIKNINV